MAVVAKVGRKLRRTGKDAYKFQFTALCEQMDLLLKPEVKKWSPYKIIVAFSRGHRRVETAPVFFKSVVESGREGEATWSPPAELQLFVTLYRNPDAAKFDEKEYKFEILNISKEGDAKLLAVFYADMAQYVKEDESENVMSMSFKPSSVKVASAKLDMTIRSQLTKKGKAGDEDLQSTASRLSHGNIRDLDEELGEEDLAEPEKPKISKAEDKQMKKTLQHMAAKQESDPAAKTSAVADWLGVSADASSSGVDAMLEADSRFADAALVNRDGEAVPVERLLKSAVVGVYFSAEWCPPCREFIPKLKEYYTVLKEKGASFELLWVSSDKNEQAMQRYARTTEMAWPILQYDHPLGNELRDSFEINSIPTLCFVDTVGNKIDHQGRSNVEKAVESHTEWSSYNLVLSKVSSSVMLAGAQPLKSPDGAAATPAGGSTPDVALPVWGVAVIEHSRRSRQQAAAPAEATAQPAQAAPAATCKLPSNTAASAKPDTEQKENESLAVSVDHDGKESPLAAHQFNPARLEQSFDSMQAFDGTDPILGPSAADIDVDEPIPEAEEPSESAAAATAADVSDGVAAAAAAAAAAADVSDGVAAAAAATAADVSDGVAAHVDVPVQEPISGAPGRTDSTVVMADVRGDFIATADDVVADEPIGELQEESEDTAVMGVVKGDAIATAADVKDDVIATADDVKGDVFATAANVIADEPIDEPSAGPESTAVMDDVKDDATTPAPANAVIAKEQTHEAPEGSESTAIVTVDEPISKEPELGPGSEAVLPVEAAMAATIAVVAVARAVDAEHLPATASEGDGRSATGTGRDDGAADTAVATGSPQPPPSPVTESVSVSVSDTPTQPADPPSAPAAGSDATKPTPVEAKPAVELEREAESTPAAVEATAAVSNPEAEAPLAPSESQPELAEWSDPEDGSDDESPSVTAATAAAAAASAAAAAASEVEFTPITQFSELTEDDFMLEEDAEDGGDAAPTVTDGDAAGAVEHAESSDRSEGVEAEVDAPPPSKAADTVNTRNDHREPPVVAAAAAAAAAVVLVSKTVEPPVSSPAAATPQPTEEVVSSARAQPDNTATAEPKSPEPEVTASVEPVEVASSQDTEVTASKESDVIASKEPDVTASKEPEAVPSKETEVIPSKEPEDTASKEAVVAAETVVTETTKTVVEDVVVDSTAKSTTVATTAAAAQDDGDDDVDGDSDDDDDDDDDDDSEYSDEDDSYSDEYDSRDEDNGAPEVESPSAGRRDEDADLVSPKKGGILKGVKQLVKGKDKEKKQQSPETSSSTIGGGLSVVAATATAAGGTSAAAQASRASPKTSASSSGKEVKEVKEKKGLLDRLRTKDAVIGTLQREIKELKDENEALLEENQTQVERVDELQLLVQDLRQQSEVEEAEKAKLEKQIMELNVKLVLKGWLSKRGVQGPTKNVWRRRYFELGDAGLLNYYAETDEIKPRGTIDLNVMTGVQEQAPDQQADVTAAVFKVVTQTRTYELMARDRAMMNRWINALDAYHSSLKTKKS